MIQRVGWKLLSLVIGLTLVACTGIPGPAPSSTPTISRVRPSETPLPTVAPTATRTPRPTSTATATPTLTPTVTPTLPPVGAGTPLPPSGGPIIELTLPQIQILAQWGRGRVEGLAWSPDAARLVVSTPLGVYLYDASALANPTVITTNAPAFRLAWSPDSHLIAVDIASPGAGQDTQVPTHQVQVWDVSANAPRPLALLDTGALALDLTFTSPTELAVLGRAPSGAVFQRWDLPGLRKTQSLNLTGAEDGTAGAIAPNLNYAATHGNNGPIRLWRLSDGANQAIFAPKEAGVAAMAFSPDSTLLGATYPDETRDFLNTNQVRAWRVPADGIVNTPALSFTDTIGTEGADEALAGIAWSPDGQFLAAGDGAQVVHVWKSEPGPVYRRLDTGTLPRFVAFAPDFAQSDRVAAGTLEIFTMHTPQRLAQDDDYLPGLYDLRFMPDGSALALAEFGAIDFRSTLDGKRLRTITGMQGPVHQISFSPKGNYFVAACHDGTTRLYRTSDGRYLDALGQPTYPILAADFSSHGFWIAASGQDMKIHIYRLDDGVEIETLEEPFVAYKLLFSPNSNQLASLTTSGVNLRGIAGSERQTSMTLEGVVGGVGLTDMAYSFGQEFLAVAGSDVVRVYRPDARTGAYNLYQPGAMPWAVAFSPDNAFLAVGWSDGQIRLYWAQDGTLMKSWQAHPESVQRLAFSADGKFLATLGAEGTIRIWGVGK